MYFPLQKSSMIICRTVFIIQWAFSLIFCLVILPLLLPPLPILQPLPLNNPFRRWKCHWVIATEVLPLFKVYNIDPTPPATEALGRPQNVWSVVKQTTVSLPIHVLIASSKRSMADLLVQRESPTVFYTTDQTPAPLLTVHIVTPVLYVVADNTLLRTALLSKYFPVTTPFIVDIWAAILHETNAHDCFIYIIQGLYYGFSLSLENFTLDSTYSLPNHYHNTSHHLFVLDKYNKECLLGHVSDEFERDGRTTFQPILYCSIECYRTNFWENVHHCRPFICLQ